MKNYPKRYIPDSIDNFLKNHTHSYTKWNSKDLSSEIISLDYDGLVIACDIILRVSGSRDIDSKNFCEIQTSIFHKILHHNYSNYINYLIDCKIIISDNFYIKGEKSIGYKINEYFIDDLKSIDINNKLFNKRTLASIKSNTKLKVSKEHQNNFKSTFKIDYDAAVKYLLDCYLTKKPDHKGRILNKYTKSLLQHKLLQIRDGQLWINRSDTNGRINSNFTTLNGDYKQFIIDYDYNVDIKNSQPLILSLFIDYVAGLSGQLDKVYDTNSSSWRNFNMYLTSLSSYECKIIQKNLSKSNQLRFIEDLESMKLPSKNEIKLWKELCQKGEIYEHFQREIFRLTGKKFTRTEVKEIFITILYSSNRSQSEYKKLFSAIFPSIYNFISKVKNSTKEKRSHRIFPILMQGIESFLMVEQILPKLDKMKIKYHFIHDGLVIKENDVDRVELLIMQEFGFFRLSPSLSIEKLKKS